MNAEEIIKFLNLKPHPEGGFFLETYRSDEAYEKKSLPERYDGDRSYGTAIYYMLTADTFSVMHRLKSDEIFHFHMGDSVEMLILPPEGKGRGQIITMGHDIKSGEKLQVMVPRDYWQGMRLKDGGKYALFGTTVAPGFEYSDYEESKCEPLAKKYPEFTDMIKKLTRG
ncbi:MAG: cupin domain-containing protein [Candidatus Wallbacteria bacterium]